MQAEAEQLVEAPITQVKQMTQEEYEHFLLHSGKPKHFDINQYVESIKMIAPINLIFAMEMTSRVPAYYRDYPTPELIGIKYELEQMFKTFDPTKKDDGSKPKGFDLNTWIESMVGLINADEFQFAICNMFEKTPAYYFNTHSKALYEFKKWAWEKLITVQEYAKGEVGVLDQPITRDLWDHPGSYRFRIVDQFVDMYNQRGQAPYVIDLGPANYTLVQGFRFNQRKFKYKGIALRELAEKPPEWQEKQDFNQPVIYVAEEVIEHLWQPDEIYQYSVKECFEPDVVIISTPRHTFAGGVDHRRSLYMGHIRTYTTQELVNYCKRHWPLYGWSMVDGPQLVAVGQKETPLR